MNNVKVDIIVGKKGIHIKRNWGCICKVKTIMTKGDGLGDRWTQVIKKKHMVGDQIPFYLNPLRKLDAEGHSILISVVMDGKEEFQRLVIPISKILQSNNRIGRGVLTQVLFDPEINKEF